MLGNRDVRLHYSTHFLAFINHDMWGKISVKRKHHLTAGISTHKLVLSLHVDYFIKTSMSYPPSSCMVQITLDKSSTMVQVWLRYINRSGQLIPADILILLVQGERGTPFPVAKWSVFSSLTVLAIRGRINQFSFASNPIYWAFNRLDASLSLEKVGAGLRRRVGNHTEI